MVTMQPLRDAIARTVRSRVAGPDGPQRARELFDQPGPRWFGPERPIRLVHSDASMFVGGLRALLLQSLHPLAMAGVAEHSDYRHDPWGRLQRTADFLTATTFGPADEADRACAVVRRVHARVAGVAPDGRPYAANDPHLLQWVHLAEIDSFLTAHQRYGRAPLDAAGRDDYVADMAVVARAVGVLDPPTTVAELHDALARYRPELRATPAAREAARFLLVPPMPLAARGPYAVLSAAAVALLPWWARLALWLPVTPVADAVVVKPAGRALVDVLRWALTSPPNADVRASAG
jgi:uncharacterized protein (DUF2236 family)